MTTRELKRKKIDLHTDGRLSIVFLGCGAAFAKTLNQNNILIIKGDDHVLVDCGTKTPRVLFDHGVPISAVETFLITHSHADHVGGLEEAMLTARYVARKKPTVVITPEYEQVLWTESLRGGAEHNERSNGKELRFRDFWNVVRPRKVRGLPRDTRTATIGSIDVKIFRTRHYPQQATSWTDSQISYGLIIDDRILFTGDTQFDGDLVPGFGAKFDLETIFHDVQFFTGGIHASLDEVASLPAAERKRTYLMHYPDSYKDHVSAVDDLGFRGFARELVYYDFA
ncbi:MAG: MBL fold metallo-hydrolase [Spirochaetaceae bacterium]|nr:MAG: MBL fold metallo-hydrolase [Spirochaetaceae bacterium]